MITIYVYLKSGILFLKYYQLSRGSRYVFSVFRVATRCVVVVGGTF